MISLNKFCIFFALFFTTVTSISALERADLSAMENVIQGYVNAWNEHEGKGFGDAFTDDADFVNIYGMNFSGKDEIEMRHVRILETFLKGSVIQVLNVQFREVQTGVVVALVRWRLKGYRGPGDSMDGPGETRDGIFTHVFVNKDNSWKITTCQNTLAAPLKPISRS